MAAAGRPEGAPGASACRVFLVAGHNIQFPHAAYGTQLSFMNQVRKLMDTRTESCFVRGSIVSCKVLVAIWCKVRAEAVSPHAVL